MQKERNFKKRLGHSKRLETTPELVAARWLDFAILPG